MVVWVRRGHTTRLKLTPPNIKEVFNPLDSYVEFCKLRNRHIYSSSFLIRWNALSDFGNTAGWQVD